MLSDLLKVIPHQRQSVDGVAKFPAPNPYSFTEESCKLECGNWHVCFC